MHKISNIKIPSAAIMKGYFINKLLVGLAWFLRQGRACPYVLTMDYFGEIAHEKTYF